uniref:Uncharacterized protein n=1 Tax=Podoviridae sp. ctZkC8 TaxID=2825259 RepID=A0A8S5UC35_9CAUD|nr:MAG TPA: hypothetical protein [Podoviridae sp. ctZkC8]DAI58235.1 MAG TPA: hypothetical protein [Crassvirales sp.]DAJ23313.1 MAG TPA: hypothetical protein [Caudoviricetes sp.]DAN22607.1 MAG TPA_asm: hypothetical protein [Bacteriophage sp.]DAJ24121.1 MAG TPA: hypothetical protein [Caudoviricetes sp.]
MKAMLLLAAVGVIRSMARCRPITTYITVSLTRKTLSV